MDYKKILDELANPDNPIALGGCRAEKINHECCDYNIVIFDQTDDNDSVIEIDDEFVRLHHADLNESRKEILIQYSNLEIISDPTWELKIFLSKIKESGTLFNTDKLLIKTFFDKLKNSDKDADDILHNLIITKCIEQVCYFCEWLSFICRISCWQMSIWCLGFFRY